MSAGKAMGAEGEKHFASGEAATALEVLRFNAPTCDDWRIELLSLDDALWRMQLQRERALAEEISALKTLGADARLGRFILALSTQSEGAVNLELPFEKGLIAAALGVRQATLSRSLARYRALGVKVRARNLIIEDMARLRHDIDMMARETEYVA